MKIRNGFVSNSSSSSFVITNKTNRFLTLGDFVKELSGSGEGEQIPPRGEITVHVSNESDDPFERRLYELIERDEGDTESFKWKEVDY